MIGGEIVGALQRYELHGIPTGGFLRAILENDLFRAVGVADTSNRPRIAEIVLWIEKHMPPESYGSAEAIRGWLKIFEGELGREGPNEHPSMSAGERNRDMQTRRFL